MWLKTAKEVKEQQFRQNLILATGEAGEKLVQDHTGFIPLQKKSDLLFPSDRLQNEYFKQSVIQRFTKEEISEIIHKSLENHMLDNIHFEFAITQNSLTGDIVQSENFDKYYLDTANNIQNVLPLVAPSGSAMESLNKEEYLIVIVPNEKTIILKGITWFIFGAVMFTLIITAAFFVTIRTLLKQKKLSEIKSDFINNMTHEFKTPLATISLAVDALKNEKVSSDPEKTGYFTNIIKEENKRMNKQVETILQAALLDKQRVELNLKLSSAQSLINEALNNIQLPVLEKNGQLIIEFKAEQDMILADEVHFVNLINNLLDNALKYSKDHPVIKLATSNVNHHLKIKIEDNGIGMNKETVGRIFEKFYRAHTGNIHNVKGFGLGLNYVKTMVDAHKGTIRADSIIGKGTTFTIILPLAKISRK